MHENEAVATTAKARALFGFPRKQIRALLLPLISSETSTIQQLQVRIARWLTGMAGSRKAAGKVPLQGDGRDYAAYRLLRVALFLHDGDPDRLLARVWSVRGRHDSIADLPTHPIGRYARHLTLLMASCIFLSGIIKDMLCLPRPLSPPVVKLTSSHQTEYGFPSSHTVSAVNMVRGRHAPSCR